MDTAHCSSFSLVTRQAHDTLLTMCKTGNQSWVQDQDQDYRILQDQDQDRDGQPFALIIL